MRKTLYSTEYLTFLNVLRRTRERLGITQEELARRLKTRQAWVSKCETGERRIDIAELRAICNAMGISLAEFASDFEAAISQPSDPGPESAGGGGPDPST